MSLIGLTGSHRTGKTTLAREYAEKAGAAFLETSTSKIFQELHISPADTFSFEARLDIQELILARTDALYESVDPLVITVTDRTPLCMAAYTLAEAVGGAVPDHCQLRLIQYVNRCFDVINKRFSTVLLVQPGIALTQAEGKAALNQGYIDHMNALAMGLLHDERLKVPHFYMPKLITDLKDRVSAMEGAVRRSAAVHEVSLSEFLAAGGKPC